MPSAIAVACPRCGAESRFVPPFEFVAPETTAPKGLRRWNNALVKERYAKVFPWTDRDNPFHSMFWGTPKRRSKDYPIFGVLKCPECALLRKHRLKWPADAFYRVAIDRETLWAWDRASLVTIRDHIAATHRPRRLLPILKYLPSHFLAAKRRDMVVEAINVLLATAEPNKRLERTRFGALRSPARAAQPRR
jgi:hypothetical protein